MVKVILKRVLAGFIGFSLLSFASAGKGNDGNFHVTHLFSDSTIKKDSSKDDLQTYDPKQEFNNLFITASDASNGMNAHTLNPLAVSFVEDYIKKFGENLEDMKEWGRPYFDMMDAVLVGHGLPKELKYLAVIESNLKSNARSWVGAVGPWQFMPATARNMGLKVGSKYDERRDFTKSTHAASKYLTNLFEIYGDWLLVIAAYNGGPGKVNTAIRKSGSRDFWTLQKYLPAESKNHVKKFIATHYMMEGQGGITTATKVEAINAVAKSKPLTAEETANSKTQSITGRYNSLVITKYITMNIVEFNKLNPGFDRMVASNGNYELRLPNEKMDIFMSKKPEILNESMAILLNPGSKPKESSIL